MSQTIKTPCCAILGHVDVGKTKLLDYMRKTDTKEASNITQQIGTTLYSREQLEKLIGPNLKSKMKIDSLLIIDTPGHECFDMIRGVSIRVVDIVILMIDMIKGLEKQTISVINLLQKYKIPFIVCLNKMDKIYGWTKPLPTDNLNLSSVLKRFDSNKSNGSAVSDRFFDYVQKIKNKLYEYDVCSDLYYKNKDPENIINIVPISAETGEGVSDLIMLIGAVAERNYLVDKLINKNIVHGYILDSHYDKTNGLYHVALHRTGLLKRGDIVVINKREYGVKTIMINADNCEIKDSHKFVRKDCVDRSMGYGLILEALTHDEYNLEPSSIYVKKSDMQNMIEDKIEIKNNVIIDEYEALWKTYICPKGDRGVQIVSPSYVMMDGLFHMLRENKTKIDVERYKIGVINKKDFIIASKRADRLIGDIEKINDKKYSVILSYNPSADTLSNELLDLAKQNGVKIIHSNVVYKLIEEYEKYVAELDKELAIIIKTVLGSVKILGQYVFRTSDPIVVGVSVVSGHVKPGSSVYLDEKLSDKVGDIISIQKNKLLIQTASVKDEVCLKIDTTKVLGKDIESDATLFIA